ncbi:MAG: efflux RND transporter periplasmic adaptor subunit [Candidatus Zixiibacteriota bacterium]
MKKYIFIVVFAVVLLGSYYGVNAIFTKDIDIPTSTVKKGEFLISQKASGTVDAKRAYSLTAPRIRGLQITWLAPEGSMVKVKDSVIKFDATQQQADLRDHESALKINQTALERAKQELTIQEKQLRLELQKAERNYDEKKHEAPKLAEEARLELELAQLNFNAKLEQIKSDVAKAELEVKRAQDKVNMAQRELDQLTVTAPIPGMVVYLEIWKGGSMGKVQEGDSPWPGQGLINLPDLTEMVVKAAVSEVDAAKVDSGQEVIVRLDAFPDKQYKGVVQKKGTLARKKDYQSKVNVFDVEVAITDHDENVKPGMSASCDVVIGRFPDIVTVPLEAVFEKEGKTFVYLDSKDKREVQVGRKNDMEIEVTEGLKGGESICLVDPTLGEQGFPGDRATEPELNKGRGEGGQVQVKSSR